MSEEGPAEDESLVVRLGSGPALVLVRMEVAGSKRVLIVPASLRPDLTQTTVARTRAEALGLSPGQGVMLQLARGTGRDSGPWGPCEMVAVAVDDAMDPDADDESASVLLGRDFLHAVWLTYLGATMVMISWPAKIE